jgi:hypothetical protein
MYIPTNNPQDEEEDISSFFSNGKRPDPTFYMSQKGACLAVR